MTELKRCPFCGGKPHITGCVLINGKHWNMVSCSAEDHTVQVNTAGETAEQAKALAIEKWNHRHYPPEVENAVEKETVKVPLKSDFCEVGPSCQIGIPGMMVITTYCPNCGQRIKE